MPDTTPHPLVAILMGSKSDWETMERAAKLLKEFGVPHVARVLSAHRTPQETVDFVQAMDQGGTEVFICGAGMSAHLAGVVAAHTLRPVIGVPLEGGLMDGLDALLSTVNMPGGIPVATVSVGKAGATNAALLATGILANNGRPELFEKLRAMRQKRAGEILETELS